MNDRELIKRAASLSRAAPQEWRAFLAAFEVYAENVKIDLLNAPYEHMAVQQGRARIAVDLVRAFLNCDRVADSINERAK